jgi:hypothetical protein
MNPAGWATIGVMPKRYLAMLLAGAAVVCGLAATPAHAQTLDPETAAQAEAERALSRAWQVSRRVASGLDRARTARDRIQMHCLDRTLNEVHAVVRMLRHHEKHLDEIDRREARHLRSVFRVLERRLTDLEGQAMVCEGAERSQDRAVTRVEVWVSPDAPRIDPSRPPHPLPQRGPVWER